jgi:hypothetical protein
VNIGKCLIKSALTCLFTCVMVGVFFCFNRIPVQHSLMGTLAAMLCKGLLSFLYAGFYIVPGLFLASVIFYVGTDKILFLKSAFGLILGSVFSTGLTVAVSYCLSRIGVPSVAISFNEILWLFIATTIGIFSSSLIKL